MRSNRINTEPVFSRSRYPACLSALLLCFAIPRSAFGFEPLIVEKDVEHYDWGRFGYFLEDPEHTLTAEDVLALDESAFTRRHRNSYHFGASQSSFWLRLELHSDLPQERLLNLADSAVNEVEIFIKSGDTLTEIGKVGSDLPYSQREIRAVWAATKLNLTSTPTVLLFKVRGRYLLNLSVAILASPDHFYGIISSMSFKSLIHLGFVLCMVFLNVFFYFHSRKDRIFLYYLFYLIPFWAFWMSLLGFTLAEFWPNMPTLDWYFFYCAQTLWPIGLILFTDKFLQLDKHIPKSKLIRNIFLTPYCVFPLNVFLSHSEHGHFVTFITNLGFTNFNLFCIYAIGSALYVLKKGYRPARFYLIAFSIFLFVSFLMVMSAFDLLPFEHLPIFELYLLGSAIEVLLINLALFDKQNLERQVFRDTIEENNRQLDVANRELEARVARRTSELKTEMEGHKQAKLELERAQLQLVQAEKMSSLGELVAGVAHEINNPVNFVQNNHQVAKDAVGEIEQTLHAIIPNEGEGQRVWDLLQPSLNVIEESSKNHLIGTERISKIVNSLLAFSRHDEADIKEANINALIDETLVIINNQAKKVELVKNYSELPLLNCKGSQLSQVFMNLLTNAIYAAERGDNPPKVTIETSVNGDQITIAVSDNGHGISAEVAETLFDPFVTTKPVGEGTGMGLAICYTIISEHNGTIKVSDAQPGACFTINLPKLGLDDRAPEA